MKKQFEVGDRVRVYGGIFAKAYSTYKFVRAFDAEIQKVCDAEELAIIGDNDEEYLCHPKQCRRLKPKAKPVKKEPLMRRFFIPKMDSLKPRARTALEWEVWAAREPGKELASDYAEFIELLPGHVMVSYESLAKAWDACRGQWESSPFFDKVAKALGLEKTP